MINADQALVKKMNKKLVLREIIHTSPVSRAKLSEVTGLNKTTVSSQVADLLDDNLIFEIGQGLSSGGRRPVMLVFNKNAGFTIGIDLGVDYLTIVLTDLEGTIVSESHQKIDSTLPCDLQKLMITLLEKQISVIPDSRYGLIGICLGVPGLVNNDQELTFTPNSNWSEIPFKQILEQTFQVPVFVENEANTGAYGEKEYGAAKHFKNIVYVSINAGIGTGVIQNNELLKGKNGLFGEMGHTVIDFNGPRCTCGNRGCWELYASEKALHQSLMSNNQTVMWQDILHRAKQNDPQVLQALDTFGFYLGIGLKNIINTFDPEVIILRNRIIEAFPQVLNSIRHTLVPNHTHAPDVNILLVSALKHNATALGAAAIMIKHFIDGVTA